MIRFFIVALLAAGCMGKAPEPFGAIPSENQLRWHELEYYMFVHFGPNTFTGQEWGSGEEQPDVFNPAALDCRQWAATARLAGMKGIIITAKHHDGFCLWPSRYSTHTVRESAWQNGKGDVLKELSSACREYGLKFGVYLSPWDRNHPAYGTPGYNQVFAHMLEEVLTGYGDVFEQWFDGANGEGPNGKKQEYNWPLFFETVKKLQPEAVIFSDGGPGCRWAGNEKGYAGETNWCTLNANRVFPGYPNFEELTTGHEDGTHWVPAECDVSIRPGWFYSPATDNQIKSLDELIEIYYASVGRGANLLLNVPADRSGRIPKPDSVRLVEFGQFIKQNFAVNLAHGMRVEAPSFYRSFPAKCLTDNDHRTSWAANERLPVVSLVAGQPVNFNCVVLQEGISLGQRVKAFVVEAWQNGTYREIARGTTIGYKRILRMDDVRTDKIRVRILDAKANPVLSEIRLYRVSR